MKGTAPFFGSLAELPNHKMGIRFGKKKKKKKTSVALGITKIYKTRKQIEPTPLNYQ